MYGLLGVAIILLVACSLLGLTKSNGSVGEVKLDDARLSRLVFNADSAYYFCEKQCSFGPRIMNSVAHDRCGEWIKAQFEEYGLKVESQRANLEGYDGTTLKAENIIAQLNPDKPKRLLICAHWDSRPWADNDPDPENHRTPVMAANDGASGVAVMIELARIISVDSIGVDIGIDFVCFDAEDYGTPQWAEDENDNSETWALGAQYWSEQYAKNKDNGESYEFGVLLDMVGGEGARFYKERMSEQYAPRLLKQVWNAAQSAGYGSFFPMSLGSYVNDDHIPVNDIAGIPCIDIIPFCPDCRESSFGQTWHTMDDTMDHISTATLKAVGQTMARLIAEY